MLSVIYASSHIAANSIICVIPNIYLNIVHIYEHCAYLSCMEVSVGVIYMGNVLDFFLHRRISETSKWSWRTTSVHPVSQVQELP